MTERSINPEGQGGLSSSEQNNVDSILVIHWGRNGGGPWVALRMAEALRLSWRGRVFTSFNRDAEILHQNSKAAQNDLPVATYTTAAGVVLGTPRLLWNGWKLRRFVQKNEVGIVYSAMLSIWQSICTFAFLPKDVRFVASIHDAVEHPGEQHWLIRICRKLDTRRANQVIAFSEAAKVLLIEQMEGSNTPVFAIPLGADSPTGSPRTLPIAPQDQILIGFVGRIVEYKGLEIFVEAIRLLSEQHSNVRGVVHGNGHVEQSLIDASSSYINWDVRWIPESEMSQIFNNIDILMLPYREASQSGPLSLAMSAGVPSVVTPVGGLTDQILRFGAGVVAADVSAPAVAKATERLLDAGTYNAASVQCLESAAGAASWSTSAEELASILSLPLGTSSRPNGSEN